jgi:putative membrane protein
VNGARPPRLLGAIVLIALVASAIEPFDWTTWWLEVAPVLVAAPVVALSWRRFPLTPLAQVLIASHALILILGGHYSYARVPLGDWARELFDLSRNHYDRLGHFAQGFVPAIVAREILLRLSPLPPGRWLFFLVTCFCLAVSASYELVEWGAALALEQGATEFLGTQGDPWDSQWDMLLALVGALSAQLLFARLHDRQVLEIASR